MELTGTVLSRFQDDGGTPADTKPETESDAKRASAIAHHHPRPSLTVPISLATPPSDSLYTLPHFPPPPPRLQPKRPHPFALADSLPLPLPLDSLRDRPIVPPTSRPLQRKNPLAEATGFRRKAFFSATGRSRTRKRLRPSARAVLPHAMRRWFSASQDPHAGWRYTPLNPVNSNAMDCAASWTTAKATPATGANSGLLFSAQAVPSSPANTSLPFAPSAHGAPPLAEEPDEETLDAFWPRISWLIGLLIIQSLSSIILQEFEGTIRHHPTVVYYLTMLVGAGGNAGSQSTVLVIRGIAVRKYRRGHYWPVILEQTKIGCAAALALTAVSFLRTYFIEPDTYEVLAVCLSMFIIVFISVIMGTLLPILLKVSKIDPAHGGAAIQVVMDMVGVTLTCSIAHLVLDRLAPLLNPEYAFVPSHAPT